MLARTAAKRVLLACRLNSVPEDKVLGECGTSLKLLLKFYGMAQVVTHRSDNERWGGLCGRP